MPRLPRKYRETGIYHIMVRGKQNDKKYWKQWNDLIKNIIEKSNLSKRTIAEVIGVNRDNVRRVSKE